MRAPAESTNQKTGSSWRSAVSVARTIFSTVRAPHDPALTVGSLATTTTPRPPTRPMPVTTPSAGRSSADALASERVLDEGALVEQQGQPLADEELPLLGELLGLLVEVPPPSPLGDAVEILHGRLER